MRLSIAILIAFLSPAPAAQVSFVQWGDLHIGQTPSGLYSADDVTNAVSWFSTNAVFTNIAAVIPIGDIVDRGSDTNAYWVATNQFRRLVDAGIQVVPVTGNHEVGYPKVSGLTTASNLNTFNYYFGTNWFGGNPNCVNVWNASDPDDSAHGVAYTITNSGLKFLFLAMPSCISNTAADNPGGSAYALGLALRTEPDDTMSWEQVGTWCLTNAANYADHKVIALTHAFLNNSGQLSHTNTDDSAILWLGDAGRIWENLKDIPTLYGVWSGHHHSGARAATYGRGLVADDGHVVNCSVFNVQTNSSVITWARVHTLDTDTGIFRAQVIRIPSAESGVEFSFVTNGTRWGNQTWTDADYTYRAFDTPRVSVIAP
jgi:hypothetical protein